MVHQPAKGTHMIPIMALSWIETNSVTNCSKQVHQPQHHRGLKGQTNPGTITGGNIHKVREIKQITTIRGGRVL